MQLHISTGDGLPIYQQIMNQVRYQVASKRLVQGEQLPPVRKLAEQLLVNPNTVSRAYRELENKGIVHTRPGAGVFVADGISPLAEREQNRILADRIDQLLAEARHMNVGLDSLITILRQRSQQMDQ